MVDFWDEKVYVYNSSGQHVPSADFNLTFANGDPFGIAYANGRFHVTDILDAKVYVYNSSGQHVPSADFNLYATNSYPLGITYANGRFHVVDFWDEKVYVYNSSGQRVPSADFDLTAANIYPLGVTYANNRFHVVDFNFLDLSAVRKVYVYDSSGQHVPSADFNLSFANGEPRGITHANGRFYVTDIGDKKVYAYDAESGQGLSLEHRALVAKQDVMREHPTGRLERLDRPNGIGKETLDSLLTGCGEDRSCRINVKRQALELIAAGRK